MSPTSRRIFLYWLLLLLPTIAVGIGAIQLLRREQARLEERSAYAEESRRAAVAARARLIVENIELLVGDVQTGLIDTLAAEPEAEIDRFLDRWESSNPLVRTAFRATEAGRLLRPAASANNAEARGFIRRFTSRYGTRPPWLEAAEEKKAAPEKREQKARDEAAVRKDVAANVAQVQSARRGVQELFKSQALLETGAPAASASAGARGRESEVASEADRQTKPAQVASSSARSASRPAAPRSQSASPPPPAASPRAQEKAPDRRGWAAEKIDGRLHVFAWVQPAATGEVRGVEVDQAELIRRLGGALPAQSESGEGYALRDDQGRVLHQAGAVPREDAPVIRVPLAASLLPGWSVTGYLIPGPFEYGGGRGFLWISILLVATFVAAILAGGSLLLWQARRSEQEAARKTSFVANVSHEFKTPLTTIRLYSELLEQGRVRDAEQGAEYLRTIGRETQRLARLVNNALDFSRLEQGRKKFALEPVDLGPELGRLLDTHAPRITEAGLILERDLPWRPLVVTTDRDALEQIVLNLVDNACKYAAEGGELEVTAAPREGGGAVIRVADRGPGVPAGQRERIFEKFHRVDDALTAEKTGAGLGLSIARQLARGLGGELRCVPRSGAGAEFVLELPDGAGEGRPGSAGGEFNR